MQILWCEIGAVFPCKRAAFQSKSLKKTDLLKRLKYRTRQHILKIHLPIRTVIEP